jgi:hypothetical protein
MTGSTRFRCPKVWITHTSSNWAFSRYTSESIGIPRHALNSQLYYRPTWWLFNRRRRVRPRWALLSSLDRLLFPLIVPLMDRRQAFRLRSHPLHTKQVQRGCYQHCRCRRFKRNHPRPTASASHAATSLRRY